MVSYLNPPYPNNFQELCAAMPLYYLEVLEMRAILRAQGHLLDDVCDGMEKMVAVNFILTADEPTICRWEKRLHINYKNRLTLDQRKRVVIGYIIGFGHIGEPEIREIIAQYTERHVDYSFMRGVITILVEGEIFDEDNLLEALLRRIPAHLGLNMSIHIRKQYRQDLIVSMGGAVGDYSLFEPVGPPHVSATQQVPLWQGTREYASFAGDTPTPQRTIREDLSLTHGAATCSKNQGDTPDVGGTYRGGYTILQGGTVSDEFGIGDTPPVAGTAESAVPVAHGGLSKPKIVTDTPSTKKATRGLGKASGGLFCVTHIKSKLIE